MPDASNQLSGLTGDELQDKIHTLREQQEEIALESMNTRDNPCLPDAKGDYSPAISSLDEVQTLLLDVLRRFEQRHEFFSPLEVQIACVEMNHIIQKGLTPQPRLQIFLLGAFANFIDSNHHRGEILRLVRGGFDQEEDTISQLMQHVQQAHERWFFRIGQGPGKYLMQFASNGTARLVDLLQTGDPALTGHQTALSGFPAGLQEWDPLPDCAIRQIMQRNLAEEKRKCPVVFSTCKPYNVKVPYWPVALATDELGYRYLSEETLDSVLPVWRALLASSPEVMCKYRRTWQYVATKWAAWIHAEKEKLKSLNMEWPASWRDHGQNMGKTTDKSQVMVEVRLRRRDYRGPRKTSRPVPSHPLRRSQGAARTQLSGPRNRRWIRYDEHRASGSESPRSSSAPPSSPTTSSHALEVMEGSEDARSGNENDGSESSLDKSANNGDTDITKLCQVIESISNQLQGVEVGMKALQSQQAKLETDMQEWLGTSNGSTTSDEDDHVEQGESDDNEGESPWQPTLFNLNQNHED
ncbi:uncharacterized protein N7496_004851 [Penicillium cataractarum]|uniref:Uncharacterized protein n=1 Tax=Penicillium cataractarum TaxID=2100454 RepID=A0A9W9VD02_9EURO|nr:uncharacterized protein N7496_004851 [Penicillium cataractarum]KAJ5377442.1 hypothetical protein N7496_004851 [Penicillium cataractarum]